MRLSGLFRTPMSRKYPIRRDSEGRSLRERCFTRFDGGQRPAEMARELNVKEATVQRYFRDWQRVGPNFEQLYSFVKELFKKISPERDGNVELFSRLLGISTEELEAILSQPHGLRRLIAGKLRFPVQAEADHKRHVALALAVLIADHLLQDGQFEDVYGALRRYILENKRYRQEEEADIAAENQIMPLLHEILTVEIEKERQGRVKPDTLSEAECQTLFKLRIQKERKETEEVYWTRLCRLMAEGLTEEQAREKIYRDALTKGNFQSAKLLREMQNQIHPLQKDNPMPPESPAEPPSPQ